jgi:imidazolonepropionase
MTASGESADGLWHGLHVEPALCESAAAGVDAIGVREGRIAWLGRIDAAPPQWRNARRHDGRGAYVTPGLVDCHTHLVYAGDRAGEFAQRLAGASYADIARKGGGILATVRATRAASEDALLAAAAKRLAGFLAEGVCAIEIKSGYGLDLASERKLLRVARRLGAEHGVDVRTTFLGAHALPPEFAGRADAYVDAVCGEMLPALAAEGLVDAVDVFCETIAFSVAQCERVFVAAAALGLDVKMHAGQLSDLGGVELAARFGARSADHLEHVSTRGIDAMRAAGMVAVLLPAAYYALRDTHAPPVDALREAGVPIAVASDHNPGTAPVRSLLLTMNMAATLFRLTVAEILDGVTRHAARALGLEATHGTLGVGRPAHFLLFDAPSADALAYWIGAPRPRVVVRGGRIVAETGAAGVAGA